MLADELGFPDARFVRSNLYDLPETLDGTFDIVYTSGGVLGKVSKMGDTFVGVEVANGVEIQVQRTAVVQVMPKGTVK